MDIQLTEQQLEDVYNWVDEVPLSRPKRNMARDFSDAVLFAQIIQHYNPKLIELHNYNATGAVPQKINNWKTLNRKVLAKLKLTLKDQQIQSLANCAPNMVQRLIYKLKKSIQKGQFVASPSTVSKISKTNTSLSFGLEMDKPKRYHKMSYDQIKKHKSVRELTSAKDDQIQQIKSQIGLLLLKSSKLEQLLKSKDKQIQELVGLIKANKK